MKQLRSIVVVYDGDEPTPSVIRELYKVVVGSAIATDCRIATLDRDDIITSVAKNVVESEPTEEQSAIEAAVIFIGERYRDVLDIPAKYPIFAARLSADVSKAKTYGTNKTLLKAVEILSTHSGVVPQNLSKTYNFTKGVLNVIKTIGSQFA